MGNSCCECGDSAPERERRNQQPSIEVKGEEDINKVAINQGIME